jgi:hypothetical protein
LSRYESNEISLLRSENRKLRTEKYSKVIDEESFYDNPSFSFDLAGPGSGDTAGETRDDPSFVPDTSVQKSMAPALGHSKSSNYLLYARAHIKYIDAENKLTQNHKAWKKERLTLQNQISDLSRKREDVSMLENESKELALQIQRLESENGRLRRFKEQV